MLLARVIGTVVSSQKDFRCRGKKLLLIQPHVTGGDGLVPSGGSVVAADGVGAGPGSLVMYTQGSSARLTDLTRDTPIDAVIIGIVDSVEMDGRRIDAR
jgi:ethanolamine utilization protein EutN